MYLNLSSMPTIKKYIDRKPITASMFELNTMKGSAVMARMAGMLSMAKNRSVSSMMISATNSGVAYFFPFILTKNLSPCMVVVTGKILLIHLYIFEFLGSLGLS